MPACKTGTDGHTRAKNKTYTAPSRPLLESLDNLYIRGPQPTLHQPMPLSNKQTKNPPHLQNLLPFLESRHKNGASRQRWVPLGEHHEKPEYHRLFFIFQRQRERGGQTSSPVVVDGSTGMEIKTLRLAGPSPRTLILWLCLTINDHIQRSGRRSPGLHR